MQRRGGTSGLKKRAHGPLASATGMEPKYGDLVWRKDIGNPRKNFYYAYRHNKFRLGLSLGFDEKTAHELKKQIAVALYVAV